MLHRHDINDEIWEQILKTVKLYKMSYACEWRKSWKSRHGSLKRGLNTKVRVAVDARGMPLKILISDGNVHDKRQGIGQ
ncbi:MAG: hypothetical protein IJS10_03035 [Alphaproteobacteria bacterium]|nr:hypothetical protein [Alphaproteobacteria bacterium]